MKAVLVIDLDDDVAEAYEDFTVDYDLRGTPKDDQKVNESIKYVEDCPLRPLPEKIDHLSQLPDEIKKWSFVSYETFGYEEGWNACVDAILGEEE